MSENIVGLGELLWDVFPDVRVAGGAPFNFAWHARMLGADASVISRVGSDPLGGELLDLARDAGFPLYLIQRDSDHPTGTVSVSLSDGQPSYTITERVAWDFIEPAPDALDAVSAADVVCFGSLACRSSVSASSIFKLVSSARKATVIFDVNLRQRFYSRHLIESALVHCHVLKVNDDELRTLASLLEAGPAVCMDIMGRFGLRYVVETHGARGCTLHTFAGPTFFPGFPVKLVDAVGAGDAFTAALAVGLARGRNLSAILSSANLLGAFVASHRGAIPKYTLADLFSFAAQFPSSSATDLFTR